MKYTKLEEANKQIELLTKLLVKSNDENRAYEQKFLTVNLLSEQLKRELTILDEQIQLLDQQQEAVLDEASDLIDSAHRREAIIRAEAERYRADYFKLVHWMCLNGFEQNCGNAADEVTKLLELYKLKTKGQEEYIDELIGELDETVGIAYAHGWRSSRVETGEHYRNHIKQLDEQIYQIRGYK